MNLIPVLVPAEGSTDGVSNYTFSYLPTPTSATAEAALRHPPSGSVERGVVKSYNPAKFGFVITARGEQAMFHRKECPELLLDPVQAGDEVEFVLQYTPMGVRATDVHKINAAAGPMRKRVDPAPPFPVAAPPPQLLPPPSFVADIPGVVKSYNPAKGFGFICTTAGAEDAIVYYEDIVPEQPDTLATLTAGDAVRCSLQPTPRGTRATNVLKVDQAPPAYERHDMIVAPSTAGAFVEVGTVKSYNPFKGFGFLLTSQGDDAIIFRENIVGGGNDGSAVVILRPQDQVTFECVMSARGKRAMNVRRVVGGSGGGGFSGSVRYRPY